MRWPILLVFVCSPAAARQPPITPPPPVANPVRPPAEIAREYHSQIGGRGLQDWLKDLTDRDPAVRETAIKIIPAFGPDSVIPLTKGLIARASDEDPGVRVNAIITLGAIGARTRDEAKPIIDALKLAIGQAGFGSVVRLHAARSLANYGILANDAIGTLAGIANDASWETRRTVAMALGRVGQVPAPLAPPVKGSDAKPKEADMNKWTPSEKAVSTLRTMMSNDSSAAVRLESVQSLVLLGPPEVPPELYVSAVQPLYDAVAARIKSEKDKGCLVWLIMLQMRLNGADLTDDNVKKIVGFATDASVPVRVHALNALGLLGEKARPALTAIVKGLDDPEGIVKVSAINCLAALGNVAAPVLPELNKLTTGKDETLKALATEAVKIISGTKKK